MKKKNVNVFLVLFGITLVAVVVGMGGLFSLASNESSYTYDTRVVSGDIDCDRVSGSFVKCFWDVDTPVALTPPLQSGEFQLRVSSLDPKGASRQTFLNNELVGFENEYVISPNFVVSRVDNTILRDGWLTSESDYGEVFKLFIDSSALSINLESEDVLKLGEDGKVRLLVVQDYYDSLEFRFVVRYSNSRLFTGEDTYFEDVILSKGSNVVELSIPTDEIALWDVTITPMIKFSEGSFVDFVKGFDVFRTSVFVTNDGLLNDEQVGFKDDLDDRISDGDSVNVLRVVGFSIVVSLGVIILFYLLFRLKLIDWG